MFRVYMYIKERERVSECLDGGSVECVELHAQRVH